MIKTSYGLHFCGTGGLSPIFFTKTEIMLECVLEGLRKTKNQRVKLKPFDCQYAEIGLVDFSQQMTDLLGILYFEVTKAFS